jgi:polysaccharide biosynthesis protein PslH
MKLLWIKSDFLHPTTKGGHIRTLEMLRQLHRRHEIHYVGLVRSGEQEGVARSTEYCTKAFPIEFDLPTRGSFAFLFQAIRGLASPLPLSIQRYVSSAMKQQIDSLTLNGDYDHIVCDFLFPAPNISQLDRCVLFQHNMETTIWERHAENSSGLKKSYLRREARLMARFEEFVCRSVKQVVAVSPVDASLMKTRYALSEVPHIDTGVDVEFFRRRDEAPTKTTDIVFIGSMDWMPNIEGIIAFTKQVLPLIKKELPDCRMTIVGRNPSSDLLALSKQHQGITVTGTVADVRPYLWGSHISVVPLRVGSGTRIKIYEAMAAGTPVVSTRIGAEGLSIKHGFDIQIADDPEALAASCLKLLTDKELARQQSEAAFKNVSANYSWENVARQFENTLTTSDSMQLAKVTSN